MHSYAESANPPPPPLPLFNDTAPTPPAYTKFPPSASVPPKVEDTIRQFRYVPYTSLSHTARLRAAQGDDDFVINAQGGLTAKGLDRRNETTIATLDWHAAARVVEDRTRFHHGEARANALASHHAIILSLGRTHGWSFAIEYDIQQRELLAAQPAHDISTLDNTSLTLISTRPRPIHQLPSATTKPPNPLFKRTSPPRDAAPPNPSKRARTYCFRCGESGHYPHECTASSTSAGRQPAALAVNAKSKHALQAPNGKHFCFSFAQRSACPFGSNCNNFHACSLCGSKAHGAGVCHSTN